MTNGQMNIASVRAVTPLAAQDSGGPVTGTADGEEQNAGIFAGVLNGIQHVVKSKVMPDSGQADRSPAASGRHHSHHDAGAEGQVVDLLAQLHVSPDSIPVSEPAVSKTAEPKKDNISTGAVPLHSEPPDVAAQMGMVAFLQTGRMPEVSILTQLPADTLQKAAAATDQSLDISVATVKLQSEQAVAMPLQAQQVTAPVQLGPAKESSPASSSQQTASGRMPEVNISTQLPVDALQAPQVITPQPAASDKNPEVNKPISCSVDEVPNVGKVTDQTALNPASLGQIQVEQTTAEPVQKNQAEKPAAPSLTLQSELPSVHQDVPVPSSPESDVEIQLSQPQPITARVTAEPAVAGNRQAALVPETRGGRQRITTDQQIEKVRTDNEASAVKETVSSLLSAASDSESALGSDTSRGGDSNQGQSYSASDNQMLAQQMHGQLSTDHQKVAALSVKGVLTEPALRDVPGQVMQQIRDRLEQHDVKPGNQQITLTLSPDSLGELKMNLNLQGQKLSVEIVTENRTVRDAIVQHTDTLKQSLARQNITMESFDVTSGGKGSGNQGQNQNAWRELAKQQQQQQSWTSPRGYQIAQADLPSGRAVYQRQQEQSMLDIHY